MKKFVIPFFSLCFTLLCAQNSNQFDRNGKRHGIWKKHFEATKVLRYEGRFHHGKEIGTFKFYKNIKGKPVLSATREFQDDNSIADVKFYTSKGKVISEGQMNGKIYIGTWKYYQKDSEKLLILEHYNDKGQLHGERFVYYENGEVAEKQHYKDGVLHGEAINYSLKGIVLKTFIYENGELHGPSKYYNPKGELIVQGQYKKGKKYGIWNYYENGELSDTKNFTVEGKYKPK